jgi:hypothetical protein
MTTRRFRNSIFLTVLGLLLAVPVSGQTVAPVPYLTILDDNGDPVSGCQIHVYEAGTATLATTWSDAALAVPNTNPVICDAAGRAVIYLASGASYKFTIEDAAGAVIRTVDNVQAIPSSSGNVDCQGVLGEAVLPHDIVYLSSGLGGLTPGNWYKASAANAYSSTLPIVGVMPAGVAAGGTGTIRLMGRIPGMAGVVPGSTYGLTGAAGMRVVGYIDSTNALVVQPSVAVPGVPTAVAYDAGLFTAGGAMTWTVAAADLEVFRYQIHGNLMTVWLSVEGATVATGGDPSLYVTIPAGKTAAAGSYTTASISDNGTPAFGVVATTAGARVLTVYRQAAANWTAGADNNTVRFTFTFEIE